MERSLFYSRKKKPYRIPNKKYTKLYEENLKMYSEKNTNLSKWMKLPEWEGSLL